MYGPLRLHCVSFPPPFPLGLKTWVSSSPCRRLKRWVSSSPTLFTNRDRSVIYAQHPVILVGIGDVVVRGDLRDRSVWGRIPAR